MEHFDELCKLVDVELAKIAKKPELDVNTLHNLGELLDAKKDLLGIVEKEQMLQNGGQSMRYMPREPYYGDSYRMTDGSYYGNGSSNDYYRGNMSGKQGGVYQEPYGMRMQPQIHEDAVRQTMHNLYN